MSEECVPFIMHRRQIDPDFASGVIQNTEYTKNTVHIGMKKKSDGVDGVWRSKWIFRFISFAAILFAALVMIFIMGGNMMNSANKILSSHEEFDLSDDFDSLFQKLPLIHPWGTKFLSLRIACMVPIYDNHAHLVPTIHRFWGHQCFKLIFAITEEDQKFEDFPFVYENVEVWKLAVLQPTDKGEKNKEMFQRAFSRIDEFDWFMKIDDDSYLSYKNLEGFLQFYNPEESHYLGMVELHTTPFNAGAGYILSKQAMVALSEVSLDQWSGNAEDVFIAESLRTAGILPENTMNVHMEQRFHCFTDDYVKGLTPSDWWFFKKRTPFMTPGINRMDENAILVHGYKKDRGKSWSNLEERYGNLDSSLTDFEIPPHPRNYFYDPNPEFSRQRYMDEIADDNIRDVWEASNHNSQQDIMKNLSI